MKRLIIAIIFLSTMSYAGTAFLVGEKVGVNTKLCFYEYMFETYTKQVGINEFCPLSIKVK